MLYTPLMIDAQYTSSASRSISSYPGVYCCRMASFQTTRIGNAWPLPHVDSPLLAFEGPLLLETIRLSVSNAIDGSEAARAVAIVLDSLLLKNSAILASITTASAHAATAPAILDNLFTLIYEHSMFEDRFISTQAMVLYVIPGSARRAASAAPST